VSAARFIYNTKNRAVFSEFGQVLSARRGAGLVSVSVNLQAKAGLCCRIYRALWACRIKRYAPQTAASGLTWQSSSGGPRLAAYWGTGAGLN